MNKFLWYIKWALGVSTGIWHETATKETKQNIYTNISWTHDQFTFLYDNFDDYRENDRLNNIWPLDLAKKYFTSDCLYRGMALSVDSIKKIYQEGMLRKHVQDVKDGREDAEICFSSGDLFYSKNALQWARQSEHDQLSVVVEVPISLIEKYKISFSGSWDKVSVYQDIPPELMQQCRMFVIDYKHNDLLPISCRE